MSNIILLDTNALLFLSEIDINENVNYEAFKKYISNKEVCISYVSIFEILNQKENRNNFSTIINNLVESVIKVHFIADSSLGKYCPFDLLSYLEDKPINIQFIAYKKIGNYIIDNFASFYSFLFAAIPSMMMMLFLNFEEKSTNLIVDANKFADFIQSNYDNLSKSLYKMLYNSFENLLINDDFTEKNRNNIFSNLYSQLIKNYSFAYNAAFIRLDNGKFSFNWLQKNVAKITNNFKDGLIDYNTKDIIDFPKMSLYHSMIKENSNLVNEVKNYLNKMILGFCNEKDSRNIYMNDLFHKSLVKLTFENVTLKSNDFLDALLISNALEQNQLNVKINNFISFDKKFTNCLQNFSKNNALKLIVNEKPLNGIHYIKR